MSNIRWKSSINTRQILHACDTLDQTHRLSEQLSERIKGTVRFSLFQILLKKMTSYRRRNNAVQIQSITIQSINSPMDSIDTNDSSSDSEDHHHQKYKDQATVDQSVVTREAKVFLLKLLMIPLMAYAFTFGLWLYRTNYTSAIVVYTLNPSFMMTDAMYEPVWRTFFKTRVMINL